MIKPCSYHVLVRPDVVEEKRGALYIPKGSQEREQYAQVFGTIVAIGPTAWKAFDSGDAWAEIGDRVSFARYGGFILEDPETKEQFRLLLDKDIVAVVSGTYTVAKEAV
jgi:co-chaperonin GroES (HSP10)